MADNYEVLIRSYFGDEDSAISWEEGCPLIVEALQVSRNTETDAEFLQVRFRNITDSTIERLQWSATVTFRNGGEQTVSSYISDANIEPGETLSIEPVLLDGGQAQSFAVRVEAVVTASAEWCMSPGAATLPGKDLLNSGAEERDTCIQAEDCYWKCTCGALNLKRERCWSCQNEKTALSGREVTAGAEQAPVMSNGSQDTKVEKKSRAFPLYAVLIAIMTVLCISVVAVGALSLLIPHETEFSEEETAELNIEGSWRIASRAATPEDALPTMANGLENRISTDSVISFYEDGTAILCFVAEGGSVVFKGTVVVDEREQNGEVEFTRFHGFFTENFVNDSETGEQVDFSDQMSEDVWFAGYTADSDVQYLLVLEFGDEYLGGIPYGSQVEELPYRYVVPKDQMESGSYVTELRGEDRTSSVEGYGDEWAQADEYNDFEEIDSEVDASESVEDPSSEEAEDPDYILPESDSRVYTRAELEGLSVWELYVARNEVFARHGRQFRNADLAEYFSGKDWYDPTWDPDEFDGWFSPNEYEKANTDLISELEHDANSPYLS